MNPKSMMTLTSALGCLLLGSAPANGRTWRVARDGSGDFTRIQPAIDAASP